MLQRVSMNGSYVVCLARLVMLQHLQVDAEDGLHVIEFPFHMKVA
jgi:hypothetical protein